MTTRGSQDTYNIASVSALGALIGIPEAEINQCKAAWSMYRVYKLSVKGKDRTIIVPLPQLKRLQKAISVWLMSIEKSDIAYGWQKKRPYTEVVKHHSGMKVVISTDIAAFFPSVSPSRVHDVFLRIGCAPCVADMLVRLTTAKGQLPQGYPSSPQIADLVLLKLDRRLLGFAKKTGIRIERSGDDIIMSGNISSAHAKFVLSQVRKIIHDEGFKTSDHKSRIMPSNVRQIVCKTIVNKRPSVPRSYRAALRRDIYVYAKHGGTCGSEARTPDTSLERRLLGRIQYVHSINRVHGQKLHSQFSKAVEQQSSS